MARRFTEQERFVIAQNDELSLAFDPEVEKLLELLTKAAGKLNTTVDNLLNVLYEKNIGMIDDYLAKELEAEFGDE